MASSLLEEIGYAEKEDLEDRRKYQPNFSKPETLTSFTRAALNQELLKEGIIEESEITSDGGRLTIDALNKLWCLLSSDERVFSVRRNFFRAIKDNGGLPISFDGNDVGRSDQFTREGLAKIVEEYCDVEEV